MDFIGFDLGKVSSQLCIITEDGELIERRIKRDNARHGSGNVAANPLNEPPGRNNSPE